MRVLWHFWDISDPPGGPRGQIRWVQIAPTDHPWCIPPRSNQLFVLGWQMYGLQVYYYRYFQILFLFCVSRNIILCSLFVWNFIKSSWAPAKALSSANLRPPRIIIFIHICKCGWSGRRGDECDKKNWRPELTTDDALDWFHPLVVVAAEEPGSPVLRPRGGLYLVKW